MKYLVEWTNRQNADEKTQARALQVFSKWTPPEGATFLEMVGRVDGRGGYALVETADVTTIARDTAIFGAFFDMTVHPVLDIQETARLGGDALEFRASV